MGNLDPDRVRFTGPLEPFVPGLREELARLGYARTSAATLLQLAAHLSRWLDASGLGPADLSGPVIDRFLVERRRTHQHYRSIAGLAPILGYLRGLGLAPGPVPVVAHSPAEVRAYLSRASSSRRPGANDASRPANLTRSGSSFPIAELPSDSGESSVRRDPDYADLGAPSTPLISTNATRIGMTGTSA